MSLESLTPTDALWWALGATALLLIAFVVALALALSKRLKSTRAQLAQLEALFGALQAQTQRDLLAMGQRIIEADKIVRKFSGRLDAQSDAPAQPKTYGQLEGLIASGALGGEPAAVSAAEEQLLSLLKRSSVSRTP